MSKKYKIEILMAMDLDLDTIKEIESKEFSSEEDAKEYLAYFYSIDGGLEANIVEIQDFALDEDMIEYLVKLNG